MSHQQRPEKEPLLSGYSQETLQRRQSLGVAPVVKVAHSPKHVLIGLLGGKLHGDINRNFELDRSKRIFSHVIFGALNVFTLGLLGCCYYILRKTCFPDPLSSFEMSSDFYVSQLDSEDEEENDMAPLPVPSTSNNIRAASTSGKRDSLDVSKSTKAKRRSASINVTNVLDIDQHALLVKHVNKDVNQIQKSLIDMNTFLFSDLMIKVNSKHKEFQQTKQYLHEWNQMMENASNFVKAFVQSFEQQMTVSPHLKAIYRGEYNGLISDFKSFRDMDTSMQSFMFSPDVTGKKSSTVKKPLQVLQQYSDQLDEIYDRVIECCPTPSSYLAKLPDKARDVVDYEPVFKYWDKAKQDAPGMLRFMDLDSSSIADSRAITTLINQLESVSIIWTEKKGKNQKSSPKLRKLQHIIHAMKLAHPNKTSRLALARKTSKEDYANMLRIWYNELLIGRVSLLMKKIAQGGMKQQKEEEPVAEASDYYSDDDDENFGMDDA